MAGVLPRKLDFGGRKIKRAAGESNTLCSVCIVYTVVQLIPNRRFFVECHARNQFGTRNSFLLSSIFTCTSQLSSLSEMKHFVLKEVEEEAREK